ncbi:MAG: hypothetical protein ABIH86_04185 [Planctomycetota bacterium]
MKPETASKLAVSNALAAGKTYQYNDNHDETAPEEIWFQESNEGEILFIVFYSLACRWSRCLGCNLPSRMASRHIGYRAIMAQVDNLFRRPDVIAKKDAIRKIVVSNNGSILDEATFSSTALMYFIAQVNNHLKNLNAISIETRPEYVDVAELEFIARALSESKRSVSLEIAIGFEAFDDHIRNDVFTKGLPLTAVEELLASLSPYGFRLKAYFMQKPVPGMSDADAIEDIRRAIDYLSRMSDIHRVKINMHINPTYVASGTRLEEAFNKGEYSPPRLIDVADAVRHARGKSVSVFVGLFDEGLAVKGGSFIRAGDEPVIQTLELFNRTQDYDTLETLFAK